MLLRFSGLIPSSDVPFPLPAPFCRFRRLFVIDSLSPDDCDKFLAFCAEPRIPSLEKFASRRAVGVLRGFGE